MFTRRPKIQRNLKLHPEYKPGAGLNLYIITFVLHLIIFYSLSISGCAMVKGKGPAKSLHTKASLPVKQTYYGPIKVINKSAEDESVSGVRGHEFQKAQKTQNPEHSLQRLKIGCILPLSGEGALTGQRVLEGIQMAFNSFAEPSERGGLSWDLIIKDSGDEIAILNLLEGLAKDEDVVSIIGPLLSKSVMSSARIADKYKIPIFSPTASSKDIPGISPYIFRNSLTNQMQGESIADYAMNKLNLKKFAVLYQRDLYGIELKNAFEEKIKSLGGEIIFSEPFDPEQNDFESQIMAIGGIRDSELKKILDSGEERPDLKYEAIFIPGSADKVGLILPQLVYYNVSGFQILGGNGLNSPELIKVGGKYAEGVIFVDGFFSRSENPVVREFVERYRVFYHKEPDILAAQSYDAAIMILGIIKKGARNREDIKRELLNLHEYNGVTGITTIQPSGDSKKELFFLTIKNGKIVEVK